MIWTIVIILIILWLLGFVSGHTMGGLIHIFLATAIIVLIVRVITGRKPF
ncbi:MAG TPA: lmo0937 family membrane protein [Spirochaetota bacterium]